ncbi:MAG: tripartite tricarboxylate transporter substrate binding protein [Proteobacteria bacterium]|nr:tripartite tricarboxylate transporter substrate binding protein [Pseudomonadota bacterium]
MTTTRRQMFGLVPLAGAALAAASRGARAQAWPTKPIRMIIPYAPGGATDIVGRLVGAALGTEFGQSVVIDNRSGGSGNIGMEQGAQAAPDGYTLVVSTIAQAVNMTLFTKRGYDLDASYAPVAFMSYYPFILAVPADLPVKSLADLIELARKRPLNYASSGNGAAPHVGTSLLCNLANIQMTHVPYRGSAPAVADVLSGACQVIMDSPPSLLPYIRSGKLRAIAVTSLQRTTDLPDVPTVAESGIPNFEILGWNTLLAPAGTPPAILDRLHDATTRALAQPEMKERLAQLGASTRPMSRPDVAAFLRNEVAKLRPAVLKSGAQID